MADHIPNDIWKAEMQKRFAADEKARRAKRLAELRPAETSTRAKVVHTKLGTPCSPKWDPDWIARVEATEADLGRRCCGAHAPNEEPCKLEANSKNGRCRFHGGGLGVGAPKGNANARIHGLYARRIQQCGPHCPQWKSCPYAGDDVQQLAAPERPNCVYETDELAALRQLDATAHETYKPLEDRTTHELDQHPYPVHAQITMLRENLHMLQIMITRAARALSTTDFTDKSVQQTDTYFATYEKPSSLLQAHQILSREHRQTLHLYHRYLQTFGLPKYSNP